MGHAATKTVKMQGHPWRTSREVYIMRNELPANPSVRDGVILAIFRSPDIRQIDGFGRADTLTSKLAIIGPPTREDADVDYTFAQVGAAEPRADYGWNCGNIDLASRLLSMQNVNETYPVAGTVRAQVFGMVKVSYRSR